MSGKRPNPRALLTAVEWLKCNEGEDGEADDCKTVADWLHRTFYVEPRVRSLSNKSKIPYDRLMGEYSAGNVNVLALVNGINEEMYHGA